MEIKAATVFTNKLVGKSEKRRHDLKTSISPIRLIIVLVFCYLPTATRHIYLLLKFTSERINHWYDVNFSKFLVVSN